MCTLTDPPSISGSQFFLTFVPTPHLDGKHVVFGEISSGQDVVQAIEKNKTARGDSPIRAVIIEDRGDLKEGGQSSRSVSGSGSVSAGGSLASNRSLN